MRTTRTYAVLEVSRAAYEEIRDAMERAQYFHAFNNHLIEMDGIAIAPISNDLKSEEVVITTQSQIQEAYEEFLRTHHIVFMQETKDNKVILCFGWERNEKNEQQS